ncbi:MAG: response regulator [Desulfobacterales bacterium]|nr:response regulator [Desulfobacterales bacterium]
MIDQILIELEKIISNRYQGQIDNSKHREDQQRLAEAINRVIADFQNYRKASIRFKADLLTDIDALSEVLEKISLGNFDAKVPDTRLIEMDTMLIGIQDMATKVEEYRTALEHKLEELKRSEQELRKMERKYRQMFENAIEGIFQISPDGRFISANPSLAGILGYDSPEEMLLLVTDISKQCYANTEDRRDYERTLREEGMVIEFETQMRRKDGGVFWASISARTVCGLHGEVLYYEGSLIEITERKEKEKAQREREVAKAANIAKSEFLANMSHEIRTPLNPIIGMTGLALNMELAPKLRSYLATIHTSAHTLLGIINDILDFSKIEAGKLEMETVDFHLHEVLGNLSDMFRDKVGEKGIELIIAVGDDVPCALVGDPLRLGQILINLASNALKFTEIGEVLIEVACVEKSADKARLHFSVKDTGIGISREDIAKLFTAFMQADGSTTRKYGGSGLGLTISKRLVEMMEGEIRVESEPGKGSTFHFTANLGRQSEDKEEKLAAPSLKGLKVLVVDDTKTAQTVIGKILRSFTFDVDTASSAEEGLEKLREGLTGDKPFELVVVDWKMPGTDGIAASKRIKEDPQLSHIPIIMMTAFGREDEMRQAGTVGVDAFLIKPLRPSLLFDTIMKLFGQKESESTAPLYQTIAMESVIMERLKGARILLVEDNAINRDLAFEILANAGLIVETANNGKEAVEAVDRATYDCVLMDLQMPEMDGFEATRVIREKEERAGQAKLKGKNEGDLSAISYELPAHRERVPIIAMTAHAMKGDREKCVEAGMDDYVTKPIDPEAMFSKLTGWIKPGKRQAAIEVTADHGGGREVDEDLPPMLPGIDIEQGLRRLAGNRKLFKKLLKVFSTEFAGAAEEIRNALEAKEMHVARLRVHTLKGVAGNISAKDLHATAQELEMAIEENVPEGCDMLLDNLEKTLRQVLESLRTLGDGADVK